MEDIWQSYKNRTDNAMIVYLVDAILYNSLLLIMEVHNNRPANYYLQVQTFQAPQERSAKEEKKNLAGTATRFVTGCYFTN